MELTTINNALAILPPTAELAKISYLDIRRDAETYPRIGTMPKEAVISTLAAIIGQCTAFTGRELNEEVVAFNALNVYDLLIGDEERLGMKGLSLAEIAKVVRKAVLGGAKNEMYGINVASIYRAIADYCRTEGHMASVQVDKEREKKAIEAFRKTAIGIATDCGAVAIAKARRAK